MPLLPRFPVEGGCICGAVRYRLTAPPLAVYACHCRDCQRTGSGPYVIGMIVGRTAFLATGRLVTTERTAESGRIIRQMSCEGCGCRIWHETKAVLDTVVVRAGTLDAPDWARPAAHSWTRSKLVWIDLGDAPQFAGPIPSRQSLYDAWAAYLASS